MQTFSITEGRKKLGEFVNIVKFQRQAIALGNHGKPEVLLIAFVTPKDDNPMATVNASSSSFAFLDDEPNLYSTADVKHVH